ncbi:hypothetical protein C8R32_11614 [Nitrosospira sp. Nsp5]|uniref:Gp5/Type VI secretion system Vgr protein OB-fold domain-containing protein n=1 Tax=Nitrosospira multiformis TaxID=1231 RepID=A0ABY0TCK5_9PROT|nr:MULTISPECIES: phage baseplate assembly protein V [Nitrosospira]PTR05768.1 hypothetical protein C8R32_11614 [Nitrosospira sp. Nsp5]SDQ62488.1 hypothetical protein SAMN05216402_1597 [Nitrosospira multiformis]
MTSSGTTGRFYGKYRGVVTNNVDPDQTGRLMVQVPDVLSLVPSSWAEPCVPLAGSGAPMGMYMVPPIGAGVWVEFEAGDPNCPIWTGCRWGSKSDIPSSALAGNPAAPNMVMQTAGQLTFMLSDMPGPTGGILLKTAAGASISINDTGITITNGQGATIKLSGSSVDINQGALTVT